MREIKFRQRLKKHFWHNDDKFHYWGYIEGSFVSPMGKNEANGDSEQFTGLQDCEGNDIYEGDIVAKYEQDTSSDEYRDWIENEDFDGYLDENLEALIPMIQSNVDVVTMSRFPVFWLKGEEFGHEGDDLQYSREYKVIGNIHENKDLLQC